MTSNPKPRRRNAQIVPPRSSDSAGKPRRHDRLGRHALRPAVFRRQPGYGNLAVRVDGERPRRWLAGKTAPIATIGGAAAGRSSAAMIHVRNLAKHYADLRRGRFVALGGISFDALPGQIFGLLGPNGAGKTTALRILSTVLRPPAGRPRSTATTWSPSRRRSAGRSASCRPTPRSTTG